MDKKITKRMAIRLGEKTVEKIEFLISKNKYDDYSDFIRKAVYEKLDKEYPETTIDA